MKHAGMYSTWPWPRGPCSPWPRRQVTNEETAYYRIVLGKWIQPASDPWFENLNVRNQPDGTSCLEGAMTDQTALFGLLLQIRELGLPLISVERAEATWI